MKVPNQFARNYTPAQRAQRMIRIPKLAIMALIGNMKNAF